jgi:TatA/E family protein of Tat protein translocase
VRFGIWELLIIAVVIILLFNGKRLARLGQAFGRSKKEYQKGLEEPVDVEFRDLSKDEEKVGRR